MSNDFAESKDFARQNPCFQPARKTVSHQALRLKIRFRKTYSGLHLFLPVMHLHVTLLYYWHWVQRIKARISLVGILAFWHAARFCASTLTLSVLCFPRQSSKHPRGALHSFIHLGITLIHTQKHVPATHTHTQTPLTRTAARSS